MYPWSWRIIHLHQFFLFSLACDSCLDMIKVITEFITACFLSSCACRSCNLSIGASFAGFYYICLCRSTGEIDGYYYHANSEMYRSSNKVEPSRIFLGHVSLIQNQCPCLSSMISHALTTQVSTALPQACCHSIICLYSTPLVFCVQWVCDLWVHILHLIRNALFFAACLLNWCCSCMHALITYMKWYVWTTPLSMSVELIPQVCLLWMKSEWVYDSFDKYVLFTITESRIMMRKKHITNAYRQSKKKKRKSKYVDVSIASHRIHIYGCKMRRE
jgi:hypothetical protein